jgi:hypothetical protein
MVSTDCGSVPTDHELIPTIRGAVSADHKLISTDRGIPPTRWKLNFYVKNGFLPQKDEFRHVKRNLRRGNRV